MLIASRQVIAAIIAHAERGLPHEVCGYLAEKDGKVASHYELTNIDEASDHFSMKPEEQFRAVKDMRRKGMKLRAVYHSHPETPARASQEDIRLAYDPEISYVIISLAEAAPAVRSFRIRNGEATPEPLKIFNE